MKKKNLKLIIKILIIFILAAIVVFILPQKIEASTAATYFYGEPIIIENKENVEMLLNEVTVNIVESKVDNVFFLKNKASNETKTKLTIKLEDEKLNTSIENLSIIVNNLKISHITQENGEYSFYVKIPANGGKKIEISYNTENDLKNAKVIKYTLEKLKGENIKHFRYSVIIPEEDIPLVTGIYPECFNFSDNTVSVDYYDFKVNSLTSDFIIEKETYKNLLYGEKETTEYEEVIIKNARKWIKEGLDINYDKAMEDSSNERISLSETYKNVTGLELTDSQYYGNFYNSIAYKSIFQYAVCKQILKDNKLELAYSKYNDDYAFNIFNLYDLENKNSFPLTRDFIYSSLANVYKLYGTKVCVDFIESEGEKELYVLKNISGIDETEIPEGANVDDYFKYVKYDEMTILKTKTGQGNASNIAPEVRKIYINQAIDGSTIEATDEEKIQYVNMINADIYVRFAIYDGNVKKTVTTSYGDQYEDIESMVLGYYNERDIQMIKDYDMWQSAKIVDFKNSTIAENAEIPTLAQGVGYRESKDGKYIINYFYWGYDNCLGNVSDLLKNERAQELISKNRDKNEYIRANAEKEIQGLSIVEDQEEFYEIQNENKNEIIERNKIFNNLSKQDIIVFGTIILLILILIIIMIIKLIKRGKK